MAFGSTLGEVLVRVGVDTKGLQTGLAKAKGETEAAGTTMSKFGALSVVAFAVAGAAVVKFGADAVKAFMESEKVSAQTNAVLKSTGEVAGLTADNVEMLASAFQHLTTFGDEEVQSAENLLLTFTKIGGNIFPQATQAVLDMSTALGQDLKSSTIQLGKALNDPIKGITALTRVGVSFTDSQKKMITDLVETNHLLDAQKIILGELAVEFGGSAFAQAGTLEGRLKSLGNEWGELKEGVGGFLGATLQAGDRFAEWTESLSGFDVAAEDVAAVIHEMGDPGGAMEVLNAVAEDGSLSFDEFRGVLEYTKVALDGAANATEAAAKKSDAALKKWSKDTVQTMTVVMGSLSSVGKLFDLTADEMVKATQRVAGQQQRIANDLKKLFDLKGVSDQMKRDIADAGPEAVDAFVRGSKGQKAKIIEAFRDYHEALKQTKSQLKPEALTGGKEVGKGLTDGIIAGLVRGSPAVSSAAALVVNNAIAAAKRAAGVKSPSVVFRAIGQDIVKGLVIGIIEATPAAEKAMQKIVDRFKTFFDALKGRFDSFKQSIAGGIAGFKDLFGAVGGLFGQTDAEGNPIQVTGDAIAAAVQSQVAQAQELARVLKELAAKGLNQQLLAQLAGQGAAAIPEAQALLADPTLIATMNEAYAAITRAAQSTADKLGDRFFGNAIDRAKDRMDMLSEALHALTRAVNQTTNITVNVQGSIMAEADLMRQIRQAAQQGAARNGNVTGF